MVKLSLLLLKIHNLVQILLWGIVFMYCLILSILKGQIYYPAMQRKYMYLFLCSAQLLQWFDVVFAFLEITKNNWVSCFLQILGRNYIGIIILGIYTRVF